MIYAISIATSAAFRSAYYVSMYTDVRGERRAADPDFFIYHANYAVAAGIVFA